MIWLVAALACRQLAALHLEGREHAPPTASSNLLAEVLRESQSAARSLPDVDQFAADWKLRMSKETHLSEPLPTGVQLVLALPSTQAQGAYWKIIKDTWVKQRGVCLLGKATQQPEPGCNAHVVSVFGEEEPWSDGRHKAPLNGFEFLGDGQLHLKMKENRDSGKILYMFRTLATELPWATHIAKVDMDAYPYVNSLVSSLQAKQSCASDFQYWGHGAQVAYKHKFSCKLHGNYSLNYFCSAQGCSDQTPCWVFNEGGTYILSRSLALAVTTEGGHYDKDPLGVEDILLGQRIHEYTLKNQACVTTGNFPGAWYHKQQSEVAP